MIKIFGILVYIIEAFTFLLPLIFRKELKESLKDLKVFFWDERPRTWKDFKEDLFGD